ILIPHPPTPTLFPYTTLFRSDRFVTMIKNNHIFVKHQMHIGHIKVIREIIANFLIGADRIISDISNSATDKREGEVNFLLWKIRSEEHTSELQSRFDLVCRLL